MPFLLIGPMMLLAMSSPLANELHLSNFVVLQGFSHLDLTSGSVEYEKPIVSAINVFVAKEMTKTGCHLGIV